MDSKNGKNRKTIRSVNDDSARLAKKPSPDPISPIGPTDPNTTSKAVGGPSAKLPPKRPDSESNLSRKQMMRRRRNQGKKNRFQGPVPEEVEEDDNPGLLDETSAAETPEPQATQSIESIPEGPLIIAPELPTSPPAVEPIETAPEPPMATSIEADALPSAPVPFRWNTDALELTPAAHLDPMEYPVLDRATQPVLPVQMEVTAPIFIPANHNGNRLVTRMVLMPDGTIQKEVTLKVGYTISPDGPYTVDDMAPTPSELEAELDGSVISEAATNGIHRSWIRTKGNWGNPSAYVPPWNRRPERPVAPCPVAQPTPETPEASPTSGLWTGKYATYFYHGLGPQPRPLRVRIQSPGAPPPSLEMSQNEPDVVCAPPNSSPAAAPLDGCHDPASEDSATDESTNNESTEGNPTAGKKPSRFKRWAKRGTDLAKTGYQKVTGGVRAMAIGVVNAFTTCMASQTDDDDE